MAKVITGIVAWVLSHALSLLTSVVESVAWLLGANPGAIQDAVSEVTIQINTVYGYLDGAGVFSWLARVIDVFLGWDFLWLMIEARVAVFFVAIAVRLGLWVVVKIWGSV